MVEVRQHGYGLAHSYDKDDDVDDDVSHESKGHGVSAEWIKGKVSSFAEKGKGKKGTKKRLEHFTNKMGEKMETHDRAQHSPGGKIGGVKGSESMRKKYSGANSSGWAAWKAKKGK